MSGLINLSPVVKIIMDKISKRSKGYAFVEYTTEEAASAALKEMNGKVDLMQLPRVRLLCALCLCIYLLWMIESCLVMVADHQWLDDSR